MKIRTLGLAVVLVALATPALATVKVYNATPPAGIPGDGFQYSTTQCPAIQIEPNTMHGSYTLSDTGGGTVTMDDFDLQAVTLVSFDPTTLTGVFGPGAFVFVNSIPMISINTTPVVPGSTAPGGSIAWGVISGFQNTGTGFCIASPQTICTGGSMIPHGVTTPVGAINSPTYDLGTWSFDASTGDMAAVQNYISGTNNGGTSNRQRLLRGAYVGTSIPALPLVGAGVLAIALMVAGTRTVMRKK